MRIVYFLAATAAIGALAVPAAAQYPYGQYPQTYPQPQPYPGQPGYGYGQQQGYGTQNPIGQIIDQLLGNRYNVTDRGAVSRCASAAVVQAQSQYRGYGQQGYGYQQGYGQPYGYQHAAPMMRVTAITNVQRRNSGLRVSGLLSSGYGGQYGNQYAYQGQRYAQGNLSFRCNVAYSGQVTNVRISRNDAAYRRY